MTHVVNCWLSLARLNSMQIAMILNNKGVSILKNWDDCNLRKHQGSYSGYQFCLGLFGTYSNLGMFLDISSQTKEFVGMVPSLSFSL